LTPQRYLLLLTIKGAPDGSQELSVNAIAERLFLSPNTVTELCGRAERAGLVIREDAAHDLRVVHVRLSAEGERRLAGALRQMDKYRDDLADAFAELTAAFKNAG
jgi:DNA-binding MarR family transcriptional regulator